MNHLGAVGMSKVGKNLNEKAHCSVLLALTEQVRGDILIRGWVSRVCCDVALGVGLGGA